MEVEVFTEILVFCFDVKGVGVDINWSLAIFFYFC